MSTDRLLPPRHALRAALLPLLLLLALDPGAPGTGLVVQFDEPARVAAGTEASALVVVGADARVEGTVREVLVVVDGRADVKGHVVGDVVVVNGTLVLGPSARVDGDVRLFGSTVSRAEGAAVAGATHRDETFEVGRAAALFWWTSSTLALVALALGIVALAGLRPRAVEAGLARPRRAALVGLVVVAAAPLVAVVAFTTGIGLGLGLLVLAALPGLLLAGYVVAGVTAGAAVLDRMKPRWGTRPWAPYAAAALGVVALQTLSVIPFFGFVFVLAAMVGVGALALGTHAAGTRASGTHSPSTDAAPRTDGAPLAAWPARPPVLSVPSPLPR